MTLPTANENWVIEAGESVIRKKADGGEACLSSWERLVYCLWVADYGMRNAGDLDVAGDLDPKFQSDAQRIAKQLSLNLTHEAFSLPRADLGREYFDRFESMCDEIRQAEPGNPPDR